MYEEEIHFVKLLLKQPETVLAHLTPMTLTFDTVTQKSIEFLCCPGQMCGQSLRKVDQGNLKLLIGNVKVTEDRKTCASDIVCPVFFKRDRKTKKQSITNNKI